MELNIDAISMENANLSHELISNVIYDTAAYALAVACFKTCKAPMLCSVDAANKGGKHFMVKKAAN